METDSILRNTPNIQYFSHHLLYPGIEAGLAIAIVLLFLAAILSGAEMAFSSYLNLPIKKTNLRPGLLFQLKKTEYLFPTLQLGELLFTVLHFLVTVFIVFQLIPETVHSFTGFCFFLLFETILIISMVIIIPRLIASIHPFPYLSIFGLLLQPLIFCLKPFGVAFTIVTKKFLTVFSVQTSGISVNDLSMVIDRNKKEYGEDEDILKGIIKFGSIDVSDILKPRVDVVSLDIHMLLPQILDIVIESGYSRIPVYDGNFDNIKGILYVKDLLPYINDSDSFQWQKLIRPPYFIPDTKKVKELLTEFQLSKNHMAVVVDEYGGTLGIVSLEDILEEIVGEISDESDEEEKPYIQINSNTYIFDGKTPLNDFYKIFQTHNDLFDNIKGDAETLAGLILELKGEIPAKDEQINLTPFSFNIESADSRRIKQIRVTIDEKETTHE